MPAAVLSSRCAGWGKALIDQGGDKGRQIALPCLFELLQAARANGGDGRAAAGPDNALHFGGGTFEIAPLQGEVAEAGVDTAVGKRQEFGIGEQAAVGSAVAGGVLQHACGQVEGEYVCASVAYFFADPTAARADVGNGFAVEAV